MSTLNLDVNFPDEPQIAALSLQSVGLYVAAMCIAKRVGFGGALQIRDLRRVAGDDIPDWVIAELVGSHLISTTRDVMQILGWSGGYGPFEERP